jgi:hypothetical protein
MVKNIKTKKIFALVTIVFLTLSFMSIVPVSGAVQQENETIATYPMSTEELFASFNQTYVYDEFAAIPDDEISVDRFPRLDYIPEMTDEDLLKLSCFPEYFTPNQITLQDISGKNNNQGSRATRIVKAIIIVDRQAYNFYASNTANPTEAGCYTWANNILEGGDDYLEVPYGIDFQAQSQYFRVWDAPTCSSYSSMLNTIWYIKPWDVGCDVIVLMTGQADTTGSLLDGDILGMAHYLGGHFVIYAKAAGFPHYTPLANLFQHEAAHIFGSDDHGFDLLTYCIESYAYTSLTRTFCSTCDGSIWYYKLRTFPF